MDNNFFNHVQIAAVSSVTPKKHVPLMEFADYFGEKTIKRISKSIGVQEVTVADPQLTSADYAFEAAQILLKKENVKSTEIDGLIFLSETPDYIIPNTAAVLQERLGLRTNTINIDIRYGCAGYIYGLFLSSLLIESGYCNNVLLLAGDTVSRLINDHDRSLKMVTGDAACATMLVKNNNASNSCYTFYVDGANKNSLIVPAGGCRTPRTNGITDLLSFDEDGNGRTQENLFMNGMDIMVFATRKAPELVYEILNKIRWEKEEVDLFAFHQANKIIIDRIVKTLGIDKQKAPLNITHTGNCGFVSIPLMWSNEFSGKNANLKKVVACGFGAGLIAAACAIDLSETNIIETFEI